MRLADHQFNRLHVLKALRRSEPVSRTQLAAETGLNGATITAITADLVSRGIVIEDKAKPTGSGRPRVNLSLSSGSHFAVGASHMAYGGLGIGIVDLRGEPVFSTAVPLETTIHLDHLAAQIAGQISAAITKSGVPRDRIFHAGIGLPAVVDSRTGIVQHMVTFDPGPCAFGSIVENLLQIPTSIDNNTSLLAACEHWFGNRAKSDDFILIHVDLGLTASIQRGGRLHVGSHGFEPEFGHVKLMDGGGLPCRCGANGCLQAYASVSGVIDQVRAAQGLAPVAPVDMHMAFDALDLESDTAAPILVRAGTFLGAAVGNLINMNDPERVVLLSPGVAFHHAIRPAFDAALDQAVFPPLCGRAEIEFKSFEQEMYAKGAAALTLERLYESRANAPSNAPPVSQNGAR